MPRPRPMSLRKAIYATSIAVLMAAIVLPLVSNALSVPGIKGPSTMLQTKAIATDSDQIGFLGGYTAVKVQVSYAGATVRVSVQTRSDAHAAFAAAIFGAYDDIIHKFRAFGGGSGIDLKSGCSFANWECYTPSLQWKKGHLSQSIGPGKWLHLSYHATAYVKVEHTWAWGLGHESRTIYLYKT